MGKTKEPGKLAKAACAGPIRWAGGLLLQLPCHGHYSVWVSCNPFLPQSLKDSEKDQMTTQLRDANQEIGKVTLKLQAQTCSNFRELGAQQGIPS